ncbi:hypothetical protein A5482_010125 [Cyanobacterium sp. IPPAS B-1200]|uniref:hypothetical protein n=1 Tax=Cyanobacterium sp. IPPAS B-1200 TaxID=1562720 RepID=UPI0008524E23|nr:hypothetical protein [Cyanobacterium sp. IPPAS B-1200]OEJ79218.1 hypothetical protein A5482_10745 [Cyanobacterium sp. IPPAS B-1200]
MSINQSDYETALADYTDKERIVALLSQYREYLAMVPSMRRPSDSLITIPLPLAKVRHVNNISSMGSRSYAPSGMNQMSMDEMVSIPCDIAVLMCDPEWKIKMGVEILVFIHRPQEDFSDLLLRWRNAQTALANEYEWIMPEMEDHMFSDRAEKIHPIFVVFPHTNARILKGLKASGLPYICYNTVEAIADNPELKSLSGSVDN